MVGQPEGGEPLTGDGLTVAGEHALGHRLVGGQLGRESCCAGEGPSSFRQLVGQGRDSSSIRERTGGAQAWRTALPRQLVEHRLAIRKPGEREVRFARGLPGQLHKRSTEGQQPCSGATHGRLVLWDIDGTLVRGRTNFRSVVAHRQFCSCLDGRR